MHHQCNLNAQKDPCIKINLMIRLICEGTSLLLIYEIFHFEKSGRDISVQDSTLQLCTGIWEQLTAPAVPNFNPSDLLKRCTDISILRLEKMLSDSSA